jgi:hypothetical protein
MQVQLVRQTNATDCVIACMAMIWDISYEEMKGKYSPLVFELARNSDQMHIILADAGFVVTKYTEQEVESLNLLCSPGDVLLLCVHTTSGTNHCVVYQNDKIYCPQLGVLSEIHAQADWKYINNVVLVERRTLTRCA